MNGENTLKVRNLWAEEEDRILRGEVVKQASRLGKPRDWRAIAEKLPGRSNKDCRKRWIKLDSKINKGLWSPEENKRLHEGVAKYSTSWTEVAQVVGSRQPDQCAKRWQHFLDPDLDRSEWTPEEDNILIAEVEKRGRNWAKIVDAVLHRRSANDAKNRYTILQRMRQVRDNFGSTSPMSRTTPTTANTSPSPRSTFISSSYLMLPESMSEDPSSSNQWGGLGLGFSPKSGHEDLHTNSVLFPKGKSSVGIQPSDIASSSHKRPSDSNHEILGEVYAEQTGSLASWADYVMGAGRDCSTPAICDDDSRMDINQIEEGAMKLDDITRNTTTTNNAIATNPRLTVDDLETSLDWDWDQMQNINLAPPNRESIKSRTMILQQMQPEQISRVMDLLLSWDTPIDVKIVNPE